MWPFVNKFRFVEILPVSCAVAYAFLRVLGHGKNIGQTQSCDLGEETCRSNVVRALMMSMEKYDMFIMNPLFGSGLDYYNKANVNLFLFCSLQQRHLSFAI